MWISSAVKVVIESSAYFCFAGYGLNQKRRSTCGAGGNAQGITVCASAQLSRQASEAQLFLLCRVRSESEAQKHMRRRRKRTRDKMSKIADGEQPDTTAASAAAAATAEPAAENGQNGKEPDADTVTALFSGLLPSMHGLLTDPLLCAAMGPFLVRA